MKALLLFLTCFVSPLVFFTDLTRNPFSFQQLLLGLCIISALLYSVWGIVCQLFWLYSNNINKDKNEAVHVFSLPRTAADFPFALAAAVCVLSLVFSYTGHVPFFRPAILNAGKNGFIFFFVFCIAVFYLSAGQKNIGTAECGNMQCAPSKKAKDGIDVSKKLPAVKGQFCKGEEAEGSLCFRHLALIAVWPALWLLFPVFSSGPSELVLGKMLDPYGTLLFIIAFFWIKPVLKNGGRNETLMLLLSVSAIASFYGIFQFCGGEIIWNIDVNPYGRRPVSTFGNPNFLSSFVVMLLPLAVYRLIYAASWTGVIFYSFAVYSYTGLLLCSMARSSWIGAGAAMLILFFFMKKEIFHVRKKKTVIYYAAALLAFVLLFPEGGQNYRPVVFSRIADAFSGYAHGDVRTQNAFSPDIVNPAAHKALYNKTVSTEKADSFPEDDTLRKSINSSFYQRVFMWACAWQMGRENIFLGKGFSQFELFSSFYQGRLLSVFPRFSGIRTHANAAHNIIAQAWAETGLSGLAVLGIFAAVFIRLFVSALEKLHREGKNKKNIHDGFKAENFEKNSGLFIPLAAGLAGMLADNMLNVSLFFPAPAALFWYIAGAFAAETGGSCLAEFSAGKLVRNIVVSVAIFFAGICLWAAAGQSRVFLREIYYFAGYKAFRQGKPVEASALLEKAVKTDSGDVNAVYEYANVLATLAELKKAAEAYKISIRANAGYDEVYSNLAIVFSKLGMPREALPYISLATVINPFSRGSWDTMTRIYMSIPFSEINSSSLMAAYAEAEQLFPADASFANLRAYILSKTGGKKEAAAVLAAAVRLHPDNRIITDNFILASGESGTEKETAAWLKEYSRFSAALGSLGDGEASYETEKKMAGLAKFIEKHPADFMLLELKAKYLFKLKKYSEAAECMISILRRMPDNSNVRYGLAVIYETAGMPERAAEELSMILEDEPHNERAAMRKKRIMNLIFDGK